MGIFVYGPNSEFERALIEAGDLLIINEQGAVEEQPFHDTEGEFQPDAPQQPPNLQGVAEPKPFPAPVGSIDGYCFSNSQCGSATDDWLCAYNNLDPVNRFKNAGAFPNIATWGTFTCQIVTGAAVAIANYAKGGNTCQGRCLLENDNTLIGAKSPSDIATASFDVPLICPCNCTYASYACCLSPDGVVWEGQDQKQSDVMFGPPYTCCNEGTGYFETGRVKLEEEDSTCDWGIRSY